MALSLWMLQNTLAAGCLAVVVALVCRFGRFSPAVRHALWLLVLLKLVTPPLVEFPIPRSILGDSFSQETPREKVGGRTLVWIAAERFYDFSGDEPDEEPAVSSVMPSKSVLDYGATSGLEADNIAVPQVRQTIDATMAPSIVSDWLLRWPWGRMLFWGWCGGTVLFVLIQGKRLVNLRGMKRRGRVDAGFLTALVGLLARQMRVRQPPVWIVPDLPSPALCAWGRASLLWPEEGTAQLSEAGERAVVLHELAHLRRRDHWVGWLELVAGCVWWWNPLFWFVRHQLHENAELACDSWVVALLPEERRAYAEALIDVAQGEAPSPLAGVVLGAADGSRKLMERRLVMIMRGKARYQVPAIGVALLALIALATIPRWTIGREANKPGEYDTVDEAELGSENELPLNQAAISREPQRGEFEVRKSDPVAFQDAPVGFQSDSDDGQFERATTFPAGAIPDVADSESEGSRVDLPVIEKFPANSSPVLVENEEEVALSAADAPSSGAGDILSDNDRIKHLEAQLSALQKELNSLRNGKSPAAKPSAPVADPMNNPIHNIMKRLPDIPSQKKSVSKALAAANNLKSADALEDSSVETVVMTRSTYKLPPGRAVILERALRELLSDEVEIKVKNDSLQITAAQEDQDAIHHLIRLMRRKGRDPVERLLDVKPVSDAEIEIEKYKSPDLDVESIRRPISSDFRAPPVEEPRPAEKK